MKKNDDQTKQILQMLVIAATPYLNDGTLGRIADKIVQLATDLGYLLRDRLDTDAGYAAGMRELAETAAWRRENLARGEKENARLHDELAKLNLQVDDAVKKLDALLTAAKDPTTDMPAHVRDAAIRAIEDIAAALGATDTHEGEVVEPPADAAETHRGTAHCENDHTWPCVWTITMVPMDGFSPGSIKSDRIVFPPTCPTCGLKWDEIEDANEAPEQPS